MSRRRYTVSIGGRGYIVDVLETAADRFEVEVDGRRFEATLEADRDLPGGGISPEIGGAADDGPASAAYPQPALPGAMPRPATRPATTTPSDAGVVAAPLPGVVLDVLVKPGASVRRGDPLLVLEAMKMRNTIRSPLDAVVLEVAVDAGQPVAPNDVLVRLGNSST